MLLEYRYALPDNVEMSSERLENYIKNEAISRIATDIYNKCSKVKCFTDQELDLRILEIKVDTSLLDANN